MIWLTLTMLAMTSLNALAITVLIGKRKNPAVWTAKNAVTGIIVVAGLWVWFVIVWH